MLGKLNVIRMAEALAAHAGQRQGVIARNIAEADTPGYRARDLPDFAASYGDEAAGGTMRTTRPGHVGGADAAPEAVAMTVTGSAAPNGNTVSLEDEMVKAADVKQQHDMALAVYRSVSDILRASLGRR